MACGAHPLARGLDRDHHQCVLPPARIASASLSHAQTPSAACNHLSRSLTITICFFTPVFKYMLGYTDSVDKVIHEAAKTYAGLSSEVLRHETKEWFMEEVAPRMRPKAAAVLAFHREQGERRVGRARMAVSCRCFRRSVGCDVRHGQAGLGGCAASQSDSPLVLIDCRGIHTFVQMHPRLVNVPIRRRVRSPGA